MVMTATRALAPVAMVAAALLLVATVIMEGAAAAMYTVGAPDGLWDMQTDYAQWVKTKTFHPGDKISELIIELSFLFLAIVRVRRRRRRR